ncbi:MAG: BatD family protein [Bacteroidales bacterium]|nr:BatD family protein [Bacteroidales bacterium]
MKKILLSLLFLTAVLSLKAQDFEITLNAPTQVQAGSPFRLEVSVNAQNADLPQPDLKNFQVLGRSTSSSMSFVNGDMSVKRSIIYTLIAEKTGTFTIPAVTVSYKGKNYNSNSLTINVSGSDVQQQGGGQGSQQNAEADSPAPQNASGNLFVDINCSKKEVFVGEQVIISASVYSRYNISGVEDVKTPGFKGFWVQDIFNPKNISFDRKYIGNKEYLYTLWQKKALFAQKTGTLEIEPYDITFIVSDGWGFSRTKMSAKSKTVKVNVKPLPAGKPDGFGGAVGNFTVSISSDKTELNLDEPMTVKVTVQGSGNFKLFETPKVDFPSAFEKFEPKSQENISANNNGISGTKTFSYMVIARQNGEFEIPGVNFSFFDPASKSYKTVSTKPLNIIVKGERDSSMASVSTVMKADVENLGSDIKFIKTNFKLKNSNKKFFNSFEFWLIIILLFALFAAVILWRLQQIKNNADVIGTKNRRAGRTSRKRLKKAAEFLKQNQKDAFYVEILSALWGYLSDKLAIPASDLSRENVSEKFAAKGINEEVSNQVIEVLDTCEFEHYAPETMSRPMDEVYAMAAQAIETLEVTIK